MPDEYELPERLVERLAPVARQRYIGVGASGWTRWAELAEGEKQRWRQIVRELLAELKVAGLLKGGDGVEDTMSYMRQVAAGKAV